MKSGSYNISQRLVEELKTYIFLPEEAEQEYIRKISEACNSIKQNNYYLFSPEEQNATHTITYDYDEFKLYALIRNLPNIILPDSFIDTINYLLYPYIPPKTKDPLVASVYSDKYMLDIMKESHNEGNPYSLIAMYRAVDEVHEKGILGKRKIHVIETPKLFIPLCSMTCKDKERIHNWEDRNRKKYHESFLYVNVL